MDPTLASLILPIIFLAFALSAAAGLGGSLILVPALVLVLGPKEGIGLAALLLAANNVAKVIAYRHTLPLRASASVLLMTMLGAGLGAWLMVRAPENWVHAAIYASIGLGFFMEQRRLEAFRRLASPLMALFSGATSGFSGTSGPLKGLAIRGLGLDRLHFVGACSVVSLAGDAIKATVFSHAALIAEPMWWIVVVAVPLMPLAAWIGRRVNRQIGEHWFRGLFWLVMGGYTLRLVTA